MTKKNRRNGDGEKRRGKGPRFPDSPIRRFLLPRFSDSPIRVSSRWQDRGGNGKESLHQH